ncbi:MAG: type II toxin-antitoxin system RelE/ParE family toxin [Planctomycetaceae bacterium]|nr:type II toxin-antitoxin system RelE/ParE family toxin [Planctomycetaceae bacterium]
MSASVLTPASEMPMRARSSKWMRFDRDSSIREVIEGPYRIVYRIEPDRVAVVAVIHGVRLLPEQFPDDAS